MNHLLLLVIACAFVSCSSNKIIIQAGDPDLVSIQERTNELKLVSISIMDRNGLSETISAKDRLKNYENSNFLTAQPYQKVLRTFAKDKKGDATSIITSYYPTGQIRQFLECSNGRAHGRYIEWHPNGEKKLQASILGGTADLDEKSQTTWAFHESSYCWNDDGKLIADMPYSQGLLEGVSRYYYPTGILSEELPYHKGEIEGDSLSYDEDGSLLETIHYVNGKKNGKALSFWSVSKPQSQETWKDDLLQEGKYFDLNGTQIASVENGNGKRCIFGDSSIIEIQDYVSGKPEGEVLIFDEKGIVTHRLHVRDGEKHGLEIYYWPNTPTQPKLSLQWKKAKFTAV